MPADAHWHRLPRFAVLLVAALFSLGVGAAFTPNPSRSLPQATSTPAVRTFLPLAMRLFYPDAAGEWSQHAHDAQHTSYSQQVVATPWRWRWAWNGPTASGGVSSGKFKLPRNSQPVTGGGQVYIAAGSRGVYALDDATGAVNWNRSPGGNLNSTPAYDLDTAAVFVVSSNGTLYKLDAASGNTLGQFATGSSSTLPLPPAVIADRVLFAMGNRVYALSKTNLAQLWSYDAGAPLHTPPAYSPSRNRVVAISSDLYVHAIDNASGARSWRVKPTPRTGGNPGDASTTLAEAANGWPVIAEVHGYVLIKLRLDWQALWRWNPWPGDNATMRNNLQAQPAYQAVFALDLDDGAVPFVANVGHGGFGDGGYLPMGPQPVVKRLADGKEVAYVVMRGSPCGGSPCDGRWDSHLGELLLDSTTVSGYQAGYVRFIRNTFFPTDEQTNLSMAGDQLFAAHWEAGLAHLITDRSAAKGTGANPISTSDLPHLTTSQDTDLCGTGFSATHYCSRGLANTRTWPAGFYIYWKQGAVYDQYWNEYAAWVISRGSLYYVSTDGTVVALGPGTGAQAAPDTPAAEPAPPEPTRQPSAAPEVIAHTAARANAGQVRTVVGTLRFVFNNGQAVYLGFQNPHQGAFKIRIRQEDWARFGPAPETLYAVGQTVRVTGLIEWYQGDPVIYAREPAQIEQIETVTP